jgi:hypothetical protein
MFLPTFCPLFASIFPFPSSSFDEFNFWLQDEEDKKKRIAEKLAAKKILMEQAAAAAAAPPPAADVISAQPIGFTSVPVVNFESVFQPAASSPFPGLLSGIISLFPFDFWLPQRIFLMRQSPCFVLTKFQSGRQPSA